MDDRTREKILCWLADCLCYNPTITFAEVADWFEADLPNLADTVTTKQLQRLLLISKRWFAKGRMKGHAQASETSDH